MRYVLKKMQACGNDFLIWEHMHPEPPSILPSEIIRICDRNFGVGADGLVVLTPSSFADCKWYFYNSDGSEAEMCGNAARCAIKLLNEKYFPGDEPISIDTRAGLIRGKKLKENFVEITLWPEKVERFEYQEKVISTDKNAFTVFLINTGVPHAVIEVKDISTYPINQVGRLLVKHPAFGPAGTNVTFFQRVVGNRVLATTFERGVEKETFACGTGAAAAAIIYMERYMEQMPIEVSMPGGDLVIDISPVSRMLLLQGPAEHVFELDYEPIDAKFEKRLLYSDQRGGNK